MRNIFLIVLLAVANIAFAQDGWHRLYSKDEVEDEFEIIDINLQKGNPTVMGYTMIEDRKDTSTVYMTELFAESGKIKNQLKINRDFGTDVNGSFAYVDGGYVYAVQSDLDAGKIFYGNTVDDKVQEIEENSKIIDMLQIHNGYWSVRANDSEYYIDAYDLERKKKFGYKYSFEGKAVELQDVFFSKKDTTVWATGKFFKDDLWVCQMDTLGNVLQKYSVESNLSGHDDYEANIVATSDTTYVISLETSQDSYLYFGQQDSVSMRSLKLDGHKVGVTDLDYTTKVILAGYEKESKDVYRHFSAGYSHDAVLAFSTSYRNDSMRIEQAPIIGVDDKIFAMAGQAYPKNVSDHSLAVMMHTEIGFALCSESKNLVMSILNEGPNQMDNIGPTRTEYDSTTDEDDLALVGYNAFNAPIVIIEVPECVVKPVNVTLEAKFEGVPEEFVSYKWNKGQTTPKITATKAGEQYILTTTVDYQECYILKDTVVLEESKAPQVSINPRLNSDCSVNLVATIQEGTAPFTFTWAGGENTQFLNNVELNKNYSVSVTDKCNLTGQASITPTPPVPVVNISELIKPNCTVELTAQVGNAIQPISIKWSTDETTETIVVNKDGKYDVTVDAQCSDPVTASKNVVIDCKLAECLAYPNTFFPEGSEDIEKTFGPVVKPGCPDDSGLFTDYEFAIYDRWGTKVFSTDKVGEQWDGGNHPNEVYIWYAKYKVTGNDNVITQKGDVTLIRK